MGKIIVMEEIYFTGLRMRPVKGKVLFCIKLWSGEFCVVENIPLPFLANGSGSGVVPGSAR